jgi:hypothetical protein
MPSIVGGGDGALKRTFVCLSMACLLLVLVFTVNTCVAGASLQSWAKKAPPAYPIGTKQYGGVLIQENTTNEFNVSIYVNFDNKTVFVDLWSENTVVLNDTILKVKLAMNKTLPWGAHLFFKAVSPDKNTKLLVNQLKWFTLCNLVASGVAYNGYVSENAPLSDTLLYGRRL